ncbi:MAG: DNA-3-methyladenine glycosylase I [Candidatus Nomurabacteria bacterium]|nr:DNA-3-methyladenine glycosylase I [Candidatus Nomurabacteria bacterium]USN87285.1 MAG: DNA-3-methyladenine glycosylase I [Candidatus Nomurabacteria bacterium]
MNKQKKRCWNISEDDTLMADYHDNEWGKPVHDDRHLFEILILDGAQAGLSWRTILSKRDNYRQAFDNFDVQKVAQYNEKKIEELMNNEGIVRNRLKIQSAIRNAKVFMEIQKEFGSFDKYIWSFSGGKTIKNNWTKQEDVPATSPLSDEISKDLKKRGMNFVGSTIIYAAIQSIGIVDDHLVGCHKNW